MCRYLAEGILPTTNEISVLKFLEDGDQEVTQNSDGFFVRRLPAKLLREMNVVDTPGTNVILDRQQRLTEEYVPRADLVLFVMSADRPFTESEVNFLKYIRRWGKKVIFLVNKVIHLHLFALLICLFSFSCSFLCSFWFSFWGSFWNCTRGDSAVMRWLVQLPVELS